MNGLGINEMDVVLREMSEQEIQALFGEIQKSYNEKRVRLGHCTDVKEEMAVRDDMLMDNLYYMKAMKELKDRYQRQAQDYWRKFDDEAEEYMRKLIDNLNDQMNKGIK